MRSQYRCRQYRCSTSETRAAAQEALVRHGYDDVFDADTSDRRTLVVIHPDVYADRVDYFVYRVDPTARRIARTHRD
jgi:hypothetical protein